VWESNSESGGVVKFVSTFALVDWIRYSSATLTLYIAADNTFAVSLNEVSIVPVWGGGYSTIYTYDLKPWFAGTTAQSGEKINTLAVFVWNQGGIGGLVFKVELAY
jgi:hypothetical protein